MRIIGYDDILIRDRCSFKSNFAKIFINGKLVYKTSNMVVASGSVFVAQKLFNVKNNSDNDYRNYIISHFGIGSGGSTIVGSNVVLVGPDLCDTDNLIPIAIDPGNNLYLTSPSGKQNAAKPITLDGSIEIINNPRITCQNFNNTIVKCTCVINQEEPTDLEDGDSVKVDEACLYASNGTNTLTFAKITFPPKYIEKTTEFIIEWYIIC
ncbi:MAG: hypothetical protein QXD03_05830 [Candidatus Anstonellales archaeon]